MLDIKFIRENPELIKEAARKKHIVFDTAKLLEADDLRLNILREVEDMRARQNTTNHNNPKIQKPKKKKKPKVGVKKNFRHVKNNMLLASRFFDQFRIFSDEFDIQHILILSNMLK